MTEADFDLYDCLDLSRDASPDDVRAAYRNMSRLFHPDKQASAMGTSGVTGGEAAFRRVHRAYRILSDDVLRPFYDRYGLAGIRLAESLSDDEGEVGESNKLSLPEDRLLRLEGRVRHLVRKHQELRVQRLLALQGSFVLSVAAGPGPHGTHLRRRYRLQYSAVSQSVQVVINDRLRLTAGCSAHVQGANGLGAAKLMLAAAYRLGSIASARCSLTLAGAALEAEAAFVRALSPHCGLHQKITFSGEGPAMSLAVHPWLTRSLRGSLEYLCGHQPGLQLGLLRQSGPSRHKFRANLRLQPGTGELGLQAKVKPSRDFSLTLAPALSARGWALNLDCSKKAADGLTKLHWVLNVRQRGLSLRFAVSRTGLRFAFPIELWPESAGPLPLQELSFAIALWALPPLVLRLVASLVVAVCRTEAASSTAENAGSDDMGASATSAGGVALARGAAAAEAESAAEEQRRLLAPVATRRRIEEAAQHGLEIICARYGDPQCVPEAPVGGAQLEANSARRRIGYGAVDVTDCLMAKVRNSRLHLSDASKASLIGFHDLCGAGVSGTSDAAPVDPVLYVRYRFGGVEHTQTFQDTEAVSLP